MIYLFLFILVVAIVLALVVRKYGNPYTLTFIFGRKGSGKSTYMVKCMLRDLKRGWKVYTNMADVVIPGVRYFDITTLMQCVPEEHSAIYIDEGGLIWDNRNFKNFDKGYTEYFKLQRKYKNKVIINSQSFDIDLKIRQLTDKMILITSIGGFLSVGRPIIRSITLTQPTGDQESRIADSLRFDKLWHWKITWLPRYFKWFNSFEAPARRPVPFREIKSALNDVQRRNVREALARLRKRPEGENSEDSGQAV